MKRTILLILCLLITLSPVAFALEIGLSLGTLDGLQGNHLITDGVHIQGGVVLGFAPKWELEAFAGIPVTPQPFSEVIGGAGISYALMGPVYPGLEVPTYATMYVGLGFLGNLSTGDSYGPVVRFTPISVGGPQFIMRERAGTLNVFYDIPNNSVTLFWNIFLLDFYL